MKKLTIALALILCLVLCLFAFASCGKKKAAETEAPGTSGTTGTTAHVHTPASSYTTDKEPTCGVAGSESKHCTVCGEIIASTVRSIPATEKHTAGAWTQTVAPSLIAEGTKTTTCTVCGADMKDSIDKTEPIVYVTNWDDATRKANPNSILNPDYTTNKPDEHYIFGVQKHVQNLVGNGVNFYPTDENDEGNDLLVEFSFLYNETMANATGDATLAAMYVENNNVFNVDLKTGKITATKRTGDERLFEADNAVSHEVPIGAYGWHRFGMRIHETATNVAGEVKYTVTATAYLDGAKILVMDKTTWATQNFTGDYTGLLYTATIEGDNLTYKNAVNDGKHCDVYVMVEEMFANKNDPDAGYLVVGDISMTCGKEFQQNVFALKNPEAAKFSPAENVELDAAFYYVMDHDHVWDADPIIIKAATLLEDGTRRRVCSICGESTDVEDYACEPTVWTYTTTTSTSHKYEKNIVTDILDGEHFYPDASNGDAGLDFYIEFSFLWNDSLSKLSSSNNSKSQIIYGNIHKTPWADGNDAFWMSLTDNAYDSSCTYAGGFEFTATRTVEFGPEGMSQQTVSPGTYAVGTAYADFPNIGGADQDNPEYGWHRVAIVVHEELLNEDEVKAGSDASYLISFTCYIDGVKVYTLSNRASDDFKPSTYKNNNLLFTAASDNNGGITYSDIGSTEAIVVEIPAVKTTDGKAYALIADYSVTAGKSFVQNVTKVASPVAATVTVDDNGTPDDTTDDVTLPATLYYKLAD